MHREIVGALCAHVRDEPIGERVGDKQSPQAAAEAAAVVKTITEVAELKSMSLGELRSSTRTIHVAFSTRA